MRAPPAELRVERRERGNVDLGPRLRGLVDGVDEPETPDPLAAIDRWGTALADAADDIFQVGRVPERREVRRVFAVMLPRDLIGGVGVIELPDLQLVRGEAPDFDRPAFAQDADRALEVLR